jgi:hypothetical protein
MAKATKHTETREIVTTEEVTTFTLELSEAERDWLVANLTDRAQSSGYAADIEQALRETTAPLAVGDRVRVSETDGEYAGWTGTLKMIDTADDGLPYLVDFADCPGGDWCTSVERA